jgi:transglutaminase/protease-like cytokinesis protein 3
MRNPGLEPGSTPTRTVRRQQHLRTLEPESSASTNSASSAAINIRTVFKTHKAVCEGYANLFLELGQEVGLDVAYIRGKVRQDLAPLDLIPEAFRLINPTYDWTLHAWNAVKVGGYWQLVDTTWDDSRSDWST